MIGLEPPTDAHSVDAVTVDDEVVVVKRQADADSEPGAGS